MKNAMHLAVLGLVGGVSLYAASAQAGADAFNRPSLGRTWVATAGSEGISNHEFVGSTLSLGYQTTSSADTAASAVMALGGTDLEYGAIALGNIAGGSNAFVKLQAQNSAGTFDHGAFYTGNNGGGSFFSLSSPVSSPAVVDVSFCGTTATMRITAASGTQFYSYDYGTTFGGGAGLGTYGAVGLDNFVAYKGNCNSAVAQPAGTIRVLNSNAVDKSVRR